MKHSNAHSLCVSMGGETLLEKVNGKREQLSMLVASGSESGALRGESQESIMYMG